MPVDTVDSLNLLAAKNHSDMSKEIRRFIDKGLSIESYEDNLELISGVIEQELSVQIKKLGNRLAGLINRLTIISAAGYYTNITIMSELIDRDLYSSFEKIESAARKRALKYAGRTVVWPLLPAFSWAKGTKTVGQTAVFRAETSKRFNRLRWRTRTVSRCCIEILTASICGKCRGEFC